METKLSDIKKCGGAARDKKISFLSDNRELNAAISRYFKHVHQFSITTSQLPINFNQSPLPNVLIIKNEILLNGEICGIYPFWFNWGIKNGIRVYTFTFEKSDVSNNTFKWGKVLAREMFSYFNSSIEYSKTPYFESTRDNLYKILKPHGGSSLLELAVRLHSSFVGISKAVENRCLDEDLIEKLLDRFLIPGGNIFNKFLLKEEEYRDFFLHLPEGQHFVENLKSAENLISRLTGFIHRSKRSKSLLLSLFRQVEQQTLIIHGFLNQLEIYVNGGDK